MSIVLEISADSFNTEVLKIDEPVVVEFYSHSCPHSKSFEIVYEELSKIFKSEAKFVKIDVLISEENRTLAYNRGVRSVPTLEVFYRGRVIGNIVGHHHLEKIRGAVRDFLAKKEEHIGPSCSLEDLQNSRKMSTRKHSSHQ